IEEDIAKLEEQIEFCDQESLKYARDYVKLNELAREKEAAEEALLEKMERWDYLEDLARKIAEDRA
nr:ABC transporter ATP-binding protein [Eubacterium sp.]